MAENLNETLNTSSGALAMQTQNHAERWYKAAILSIIVLSVPLNIGVVIHCISSRSRVTNARLVLVASMAISDILQSTIGYVFQYIVIISDKIPYSFCRVSSFSVTFLALVSMHHITALAVDCYLFICKPMLANKNPTLPKKLKILFTVTAWFYPLVWAVVPLIGWQGYSAVRGGNCIFEWSPEQHYRRVYIICLFIFCFLIPLLVIITCFTLIKISLYRMRQYTTERLGSKSNAVRNDRKTEKKYMNMGIIIAAVYLVVWAPYAIVSILTMAGYTIVREVNGKMVEDIASVLAKSSTIFNPFIYTLFRQRFRQKVRGSKVITAVIKQRDRVLSLMSRTNSIPGEIHEKVTSL